MEEKKEMKENEGTAAPQHDTSWIPQWKDGLIHTPEESHTRACHLEHMRALVLALRSGRWRQGHNALRAPSGNHYCCLGVACELAAQNGAARALRRDSVSGWLYGPAGDEDPIPRMHQWSSTMLPPAVTNWLGVGGSSLYVVMPEQGRQWFIDHPRSWNHEERYVIASLIQGGHMSVVGLNDDLRMPFGFIADCIEYTYLPGDWNLRVPATG